MRLRQVPETALHGLTPTLPYSLLSQPRWLTTLFASRRASNLLTAEIAVDKGVTILSENGSATTFVNGGGTTRCFNMTAAGVIDGFTITNGVTSTGGGGVKMTAGTVRNCVITKNTAGTVAAAEEASGLVEDWSTIATSSATLAAPVTTTVAAAFA